MFYEILAILGTEGWAVFCLGLTWTTEAPA